MTACSDFSNSSENWNAVEDLVQVIFGTCSDLSVLDAEDWDDQTSDHSDISNVAFPRFHA